MKISAIPDDKSILKDGKGLFVYDDNFWSTYSDINAFQIDTEGTSDVELKDGTHREPTQAEIDALSDKWDTTEAAIVDEENAYINSLDRVRESRTFFLRQTDWSVLPDSPLSDTDKTSYETYRQELRDIPSTYSSAQPRDIEFDGNGNVSVNSSTVITHP